MKNLRIIATIVLLVIFSLFIVSCNTTTKNDEILEKEQISENDIVNSNNILEEPLLENIMESSNNLSKSLTNDNNSFYNDFIYLYNNKMYNEDVVNVNKSDINSNYLYREISTIYFSNRKYMLKYIDNLTAIIYTYKDNDYKPIFLITHYSVSTMISEIKIRGPNEFVLLEVITKLLGGTGNSSIDTKLEIFYIENEQVHIAFEATLQSLYKSIYAEPYNNSNLTKLQKTYALYNYDDAIIDNNEYIFLDKPNIKILYYIEKYYYKNFTEKPDEVITKTEFYIFDENTKKYCINE